jgi:hypothetical protein
MKKEIEQLIKDLIQDNSERNEKMKSPNISDYNHTVLVHQYNNTLEIVKKIEKIIEKY